VASGNDQSLRQPSRADLQPATEGPTLSATDVVDLTKGGGSGRELSSEQISALVRAQDPQIIACIDRARAGYAVAQGTVTVGFRIERSGRVEKVRLTGPALLVRAGLYRCVRPLIAGLRFPSSDRALVMTFPYRLR
jgi:outer membrane biosynthesis protein TonB